MDLSHTCLDLSKTCPRSYLSCQDDGSQNLALCNLGQVLAKKAVSCLNLGKSWPRTFCCCRIEALYSAACVYRPTMYIHVLSCDQFISSTNQYVKKISGTIKRPMFTSKHGPDCSYKLQNAHNLSELISSAFVMKCSPMSVLTFTLIIQYCTMFNCAWIFTLSEQCYGYSLGALGLVAKYYCTFNATTAVGPFIHLSNYLFIFSKDLARITELLTLLETSE